MHWTIVIEHNRLIGPGQSVTSTYGLMHHIGVADCHIQLHTHTYMYRPSGREGPAKVPVKCIYVWRCSAQWVSDLLMPSHLHLPWSLMQWWEYPQPPTDQPRAQGQEEGQVPQLRHPQFWISEVSWICVHVCLFMHVCTREWYPCMYIYTSCSGPLQ